MPLASIPLSDSALYRPTLPLVPPHTQADPGGPRGGGHSGEGGTAGGGRPAGKGEWGRTERNPAVGDDPQNICGEGSVPSPLQGMARHWIMGNGPPRGGGVPTPSISGCLQSNGRRYLPPLPRKLYSRRASALSAPPIFTCSATIIITPVPLNPDPSSSSPKP